MVLNIGSMQKLLEYLSEKRGRRLELAAALKINPSAISQWEEVPLARVIAVEAATGIPREDLRPDMFAAPKEKKRKRA